VKAGRLAEWRSSLWLVFTLVPFGWIAGAGLLYAGLRAHERRWAAFGALYLALGIVGFLLVTVDADVAGDAWQVYLGMLISLTTWAACTAHSFAVRRPFLDAL
jgi:drug/metabolite transporter superfamily protein YnfA